MKNKQILLASRPQGAVSESNFKLVEADIPQAGDGEFIVRNHYLSLDPYMRGRMDEAKSYAQSAAVGDVMVGTTVGEIIESKHTKFKAGDFVVHLEHGVGIYRGLSTIFQGETTLEVIVIENRSVPLVTVEIAVKMEDGLKHTLGAAIFVVGLVFVYRSFYGMRIPIDEKDAEVVKHQMRKG